MLAGRETIEQGSIVWSPNARIGYLEQEITVFNVSGGEQKIINITNLFYSDHNVLLLDEPDNHLDLEHKQWFEQLVEEFEGMVVVISHDRTFLKNAITQTWHLEEKKITQYGFGYDKFRQIYEQDMQSRQHLWEVQERERIRLVEIVTQFRVKAANNDKLARQLHSAEKRLDRFTRDMVEKPPTQKTAQIKTQNYKQPNKKTALHIKNLSKSYDHPVLADINLHVFCGEKIAIAAPNGSGKSTLLNILVSKINADSGEFRFGLGLKLGYYSQEHLDVLDESSSMISELQKSQAFEYYSAIAYLKRFLFTESQIVNEVRFLSGGQKSRLQLAKFLATNPDILILDEPTNHLDLKTVLALENFLKDYTGTLILVSHDFELVSNVVEKIYDLNNGQLFLRAG